MIAKYIYPFYIILFLFLIGCKASDTSIPTIGFVDAFEDATISQAHDGFIDALKQQGFSEEEKTLKVLYRNAQGDIPTLTQIVNYFVSQDVTLIGTSTTVATITAVQRAKTVPIFMMVSPEPKRMGVVNDEGEAPGNLFGVGESLAYIDTSFALIPKFIKPKGDRLIVGMVYNQSEPQSQDALQRVKAMAEKLNILIEAMPVNSSADAQLVTQSLLNKGIDVFFANPDNTVFASFETILKNCNEKNIPIFTSEAGLVKRGAVAAFGADIYQWGYQAGEQAAEFLKKGDTSGLKIEMVKLRKRVYNSQIAKHYNLTFPENFEMIE
ncbi:ABC transporter substrate-binding protein [Albibacterium sp.]|uniref:ABC transporter substrate-binding protein n=1 Tax=Albibacterium sp. TaxID=2952885 RepID=UPI002BDC3E72|nr:ABC transporter substrate-binding protein [Albibacterium sp.]HUH19347.1 ABC transporter substrate-binding protein [Albibacterium sp.]